MFLLVTWDKFKIYESLKISQAACIKTILSKIYMDNYRDFSTPVDVNNVPGPEKFLYGETT